MLVGTNSCVLRSKLNKSEDVRVGGGAVWWGPCGTRLNMSRGFLYGGGAGLGGSPCDLCLTSGTIGRGHMGFPCVQNETCTTENITFPQLCWRAVKTWKMVAFFETCNDVSGVGSENYFYFRQIICLFTKFHSSTPPRICQNWRGIYALRCHCERINFLGSI